MIQGHAGVLLPGDSYLGTFRWTLTDRGRRAILRDPLLEIAEWDAEDEGPICVVTTSVTRRSHSTGAYRSIQTSALNVCIRKWPGRRSGGRQIIETKLPPTHQLGPSGYAAELAAALCLA